MAKHTVEITTFTVMGKGHFPWDMLRYDGAWPADGNTVQILQNIASAEDGYIKEPVEMRFTCISPGGPSVARWGSFLWGCRVEN